MNIINSLRSTVLIFVGLFVTSCAINNTSTSDRYTGDWNFVASTGTSGVIRISEVENGYEAILITGYGEKPINNFQLLNKHISGNFDVMGSTVELNAEIKRNHFEGTLVASSGTYTIQADKDTTDK